jgi:hypothetical protein
MSMHRLVTVFEVVVQSQPACIVFARKWAWFVGLWDEHERRCHVLIVSAEMGFEALVGWRKVRSQCV